MRSRFECYTAVAISAYEINLLSTVQIFWFVTSWKPVSDEGSTARLVCIEDDCQVLKGHRVCNSLSTDSQGLLIKLRNNTELEWGRSPG